MLDTTIEDLEMLGKVALESDEWDEMPTLVVVRENGDRELVGIADEIGLILPIVGGILKKQGTEKVRAIILCNEGWGIDSKRTSSGDAKQVKKEIEELRAKGLKIADHPDAIEVKMFFAVDTEGCQLRQIERGKEQVDIIEGELDGRIFNMMRTLFLEANNG